jgi:hypothetical protein
MGMFNWVHESTTYSVEISSVKNLDGFIEKMEKLRGVQDVKFDAKKNRAYIWFSIIHGRESVLHSEIDKALNECFGGGGEGANDIR